MYLSVPLRECQAVVMQGVDSGYRYCVESIGMCGFLPTEKKNFYSPISLLYPVYDTSWYMNTSCMAFKGCDGRISHTLRSHQWTAQLMFYILACLFGQNGTLGFQSTGPTFMSTLLHHTSSPSFLVGKGLQTRLQESWGGSWLSPMSCSSKRNSTRSPLGVGIWLMQWQGQWW